MSTARTNSGFRQWLTSWLFEFEDLPWLPASLKHTITDAIEAANSRFRGFNAYAAKEVVEATRRLGRTEILELGAGSAPLCRELAGTLDSEGLKLKPSDIRPHLARFAELAACYPHQVEPCLVPLDYSKDLEASETAIAVFLSTFHHLPDSARVPVLKRLTDLGLPVMVLEALRPNLGSYLYCLMAPIGGLRLPIAMLDRPGRLRRFFWCWLVPVLPLVFCWDAIVSALRQWNEAQWKAAHAALENENVELIVREDGVCQQLVLFYPRQTQSSEQAESQTVEAQL